MDAGNPGTTVRLVRSSVVALTCLLVVNCSLLGSSKEEPPTLPSVPTQAAPVTTVSEGPYIESCRAKSVPIPPNWKRLASEWEQHGNLHTILLAPNDLEDGSAPEA